MRAARLPFDAVHMLERMRAIRVILLGETVLTLGRVISEHHADALTLLMALGGFVALLCLWVVYFGRAEQLVVSHTTANEDPIQSVHLGTNVIFGVVAGLVTLAAEIEIVLAQARDPDQASAECGLLVGAHGLPAVARVLLPSRNRHRLAPAGHRSRSPGRSDGSRLLAPGVRHGGAAGRHPPGWLPSTSPETQRIHQPQRCPDIISGRLYRLSRTQQ